MDAELQHLVIRELQIVLDRYGRHAPALVRAESFIHAHSPHLEFRIRFDNGYGIGFDWHFRNRHDDDAMTRSGEPEITFRSIYSRLYEDHLIELDLRVARERYSQIVERTCDPTVLSEARELLDRGRDAIRRWHRGAYPERFYSLGVDLASEADRSAVQTIQFGALDYRFANAIVDDVVPADREAPTRDLIAAAGIAVRSIHDRLLQNDNGRFLSLRGPWNDQDIYSRLLGGAGTPEANDKGLALLKEWLSPEQLKQYKEHGYFEVIGCDSGKRYRIKHGRQMNIDEIDADCRKVCGWCFLPEGQLVAGDVMLAQKIALETNETAALKVANRIGGGPMLDVSGAPAWDQFNGLVEYYQGSVWRTAGVVCSDPTS